MMKFKLHYNVNGKYEDYIIIEGDTLEECREKAVAELKFRNISAGQAYSEKIED